MSVGKDSVLTTFWFRDGKLSFEEFTQMVASTDIVKYVFLQNRSLFIYTSYTDWISIRQMTLEDLFWFLIPTPYTPTAVVS